MSHDPLYEVLCYQRWEHLKGTASGRLTLLSEALRHAISPSPISGRCWDCSEKRSAVLAVAAVYELVVWYALANTWFPRNGPSAIRYSCHQVQSVGLRCIVRAKPEQSVRSKMLIQRLEVPCWRRWCVASAYELMTCDNSWLTKTYRAIVKVTMATSSIILNSTKCIGEMCLGSCEAISINGNLLEKAMDENDSQRDVN